jgi:hypothetical protein
MEPTSKGPMGITVSYIMFLALNLLCNGALLQAQPAFFHIVIYVYLLAQLPLQKKLLFTVFLLIIYM